MIAPSLPSRPAALERELFRAVYRDFRSRFMRLRPEWNGIGPALPAWFRLRLRRIDHRLVPQFMVPNTMHPEGVPAGEFPNGVWYICSRVGRNRHWVRKRATYILCDESGNPCPPSHELCRVLKEARNMRRQNRVGDLERSYQEYMDGLSKAKTAAGRAQLAQKIADTMRKLNMRSYTNRMFIPAAKA